MSDLPKIQLCRTRYKDGNVEYTLLIDGHYWIANEWEYECLKQGRSPEELGMFIWTDLLTDICKELDLLTPDEDLDKNRD